MRALLGLVLAAGLIACTPPATEAEWDMGPMPPVAALYDRDAPPTSADELEYYFTSDLAAALAAPDSLVDFDFRTWANDPQIEGKTFGLDQHPPEDRAVVSTRFTYPGIGGGMILSYTLCRRGPSDWQIEDLSAVAVPDEADAGAVEELPSLRQTLSLPPQSPACD
jgi:hypothetical protein